jgi:D-cysteine desulfhydrase family pyridoxal phosphate-dependent enzyme
MADVSYRRDTLYPYTPPEWANKLLNPPPSRLHLAQLPTPIHPWSLPGLPDGFQLFIKRDDLTGAALSGNKVRKLEFLLAEAIANKCDSVITTGGIQSNHARATAVAGRQLGLEPHLLLRSDITDPSMIGCKGNLLLNRLVGSHIILCPYHKRGDDVVDGKAINKVMDSIMEKYRDNLKSKGHNPYLVPIGGSNALGIWGYLEGFDELLQQGVLNDFDDIVMAVGSGGTAAGFAIGNYLTGSKLKIHAICACDNSDYFHKFIDEHLVELGITSTTSRDIIDIIDGYKGNGYAISTDDELKQLIQISTTTGIILDRVYTFKAVRGMLSEMMKNPHRFNGKKILFIHTGGIHSIFDGRIESVIGTVEESNKIYQYSFKY